MKQKLLNFTRLRSLVLLAVIAFLGAGQAWGDDVVDQLSKDDLAANGTSYTNFSNVQKNTAVYAGRTSVQNSSIGMKRDGSNGAGIFTTTSGGVAKSLSFTWTSTSNRTLQVWGKNSAYSLDDTKNQSNFGTKIAEVTYNSNNTSPTLTLNGTDNYEYILIVPSSTSMLSIKDVAITWEVSGGSNPSISAENVNVTYNATSGTIAATIDNAVTGGALSASITSGNDGNWLSLGSVNGTNVPLTINSNNDGVVSRSATVTLTYTYNTNETKTKEVTVTQGVNSIYGSSTNPYSVAEAKSVIDAAGKTTVSDKYVTGIVSQVDNYNSTYSSITYWISDDGTTTNQFEVYGGLSFNEGTAFSAKADIQVGDVVVVKGNITYFSKNSVYEFEQNNHIVSQKLVAPTFYPEAGAVGSGTELTITDEHPSSTIYYTTDGSTPTTSSTAYNASSKPTITAATTFRAIAVKTSVNNNDNYVQSDVASASYTLLTPVATPVITLAGGTYTSAQMTTITCGTQGATIYYTTNGDNPTTSSTAYTGAISINESMTIKAIAAKDGMANSAVAEASYTINIPAINAENVAIAYDATSGTITSTITNPVNGGVLTAAITGGNEGSWLSLGTVDGTNVPLTCSANDGNADRTATVTLTYTYDTNKTVTKEVAVTQAHFVPDYADLPFEWTSSFKSMPTGVTNNGVSSDTNGTYLKFDTDGDNLVLKINECPGTLSFDIKGNPGNNNEWEGTFTVETSEDGTQWTSLASYNSVSTNNSYDSKSIDLDENVRYIRWTYSKTTGNLAMKNISLTAYVAPSSDPSITLTSASVNATAALSDGTIDITYANLTISKMEDFGVQFYDGQGQKILTGSEPDWLEVLVAEQDPSIGTGYVVSYTIQANDGAARTAYFKVFASGTTDFVYSDLVTVTQAAYAPLPTPTNDDYIRISDLSQLTDGSIVVIAARYNDTTNGYYAMANSTSGKPSGTSFASTTSNSNEILPSDIVDNEDDYYWVVNVTTATVNNETVKYYTFTKSNGDKIGYTSSTNFATNGDNTEWTVESGTSVDAAMVASYNGFVIKNKNTDTRAFAFNGSAFGAYSTGNNNMASQSYNFYLDFFVQIPSTPTTESVTVSNVGYGTYASDNALDFTGSSIKAFYATVSGTTMTFRSVSKVPANTGVLLYKDGGATEDVPVFSGTADEVTGNAFVRGTGASVTWASDNEKYVLFNGDDGIGFYKANNNRIATNRAYIQVPTGTNVKSFAINLDDTDAIKAIAGESENAVIYNLAGQRVNKAQKGIYIINGKKVLVK